MTAELRPEVVHDERLLELFTVHHHHAYERLARQRSFCVQTAGREAGWPTGYVGKRFTYMIKVDHEVAGHKFTTEREAWLSDAEPVLAELARQEPGHRGINRPRAEDAQERLAKLAEVRAEVAAAAEAIREHEEAYTGWTRYVLVTSSAGHVHSSMECSTCRATTTFCPVPSLSGLDEAAAVAQLGETLCTVCFPSAPAKPSKVTEAQARKLLEEGEEAFLAMRAKALAR